MGYYYYYYYYHHHHHDDHHRRYYYYMYACMYVRTYIRIPSIWVTMACW